jgi:hypothetical protein
MRTGALEETLPDESFTKQKLNILLRPVSCGQSLQEHQDFLEVHLYQLIRPFDEKSGAHIQMEL